jgi:hypothetical protein
MPVTMRFNAVEGGNARVVMIRVGVRISKRTI